MKTLFSVEELRRVHDAVGDPELVMQGGRCGCFSCGQYVPLGEVTYHLESRGFRRGKLTAFCPYCYADTLIPEMGTGLVLTDELIAAMKEFWLEKQGKSMAPIPAGTVVKRLFAALSLGWNRFWEAVIWIAQA